MFEKDKGDCQIRVTYQSRKVDVTKYVLYNTYENDIDGRLLVCSKEIGKGSNWTVVFEGFYEGRAVAVKRIRKVVFHDVAYEEIGKLILSDQHSNVVRYYCGNHDQDFVYVVVERCRCSLNELILSHGNLGVELKPTMEVFKDLKLWEPNGYPSPVLLKLMRDTIAGLAHLHKLGIIHRDLKPQNVLICKDNSSITAKVSDMGIRKLIPAC